MFGEPCTDLGDEGCRNDAPTPVTSNPLDSNGLWPRKCRMSERDVAFGLSTSVGLGAYLGIMGSRRDVVTTLWKTVLEGVWYKVWKEVLYIKLFLWRCLEITVLLPKLLTLFSASMWIVFYFLTFLFTSMWCSAYDVSGSLLAFASPDSTNPLIQNDREHWWVSRWAYACPMCEARWVPMCEGVV